MMQTLDFSYNWNNKLDCKAFTTLRLSGRFGIEDKIEVRLNKKFKCFGGIVDRKCFKLRDITDWIAFIDTGYNKIECQNILKKMYKNKNIDWLTQNIYFYLIERTK